MSSRCCSPIRELRRWPRRQPIQSTQSVHPKHSSRAIQPRKTCKKRKVHYRLNDNLEICSNACLVFFRPVDACRSSHKPQVVCRCVASIVQVLKKVYLENSIVQVLKKVKLEKMFSKLNSEEKFSFSNSSLGKFRLVGTLIHPLIGSDEDKTNPAAVRKRQKDLGFECHHRSWHSSQKS